MYFGNLAVGILLVVSGCSAVDKTVTVEDRHVRVTDAGAVLVMYKGTTVTNGITVKVDSVMEVQAGGTAIGVVGTTTRSHTDFSQATFTISPESNLKYPNSQIDVTKFSMSNDIVIDSTNNVKAMLTVELYVFKAEGIVSVDGTNVRVRKGDVKYDVKVADWPFCGANNVICDNGQANLTGAYLDVALDVKGQAAAALKTGTTMVYTLGNRPYIKVSNKVMADGSATTVDMPATYPMLSASATKQLFTSRVPKFTNSAMYGSIFSQGRDDSFFDQVEATAKGNSGKIALTNKENRTKTMTVEFDNLVEVTADDGEIKGQGANEHRVNNFASQSFEVVDKGTVMYQTLEAKKTEFKATLNNGATLDVEMFLFLDSGELTNGNEIYLVGPGSLKFNPTIKNWKFCGDTGVTCGQNAVGAFLYFDMIIKGKGDKATKKNDTAANKGVKYNLGYGTLTMATLYKEGDVETEMDEGYPAFLTQGSKKIFRLKFAKFSQSVSYDPIMALENDDTDDGGDGGDDDTDAGSYVKATSLVLLMTLINVFYQMYQ